MVDPLSYFLFQPVLQSVTKAVVYAIMSVRGLYKRSLAAIIVKSSSCRDGSGLPPTIRVVLYNITVNKMYYVRRKTRFLPSVNVTHSGEMRRLSQS